MYTINQVTFDKFTEAYHELTTVIYGQAKPIGTLNPTIAKKYLISEDKNNKVVSCCIYYLKTKMQFEDKEASCFGYFESLDNAQSVKAMTNSIAANLDTNREILFAPINGNTWNQYRLSLNSEQVMFPMDISNPSYYPALLQDAGFEVARNYSSGISKILKYDKELIEKKMAKLTAIGIRIRNINLEEFDSELDQVYDLTMKSFKSSFLFSPITKKEFKKKYIELKSYLQQEYIWMAVDQDNKLVGFMFSLSFPVPDGSKAYVAKTLARLPDSKYAGIGTVLIGKLQKKAIEDKCSFGINAFMEEENVSNILSTNLSAAKEAKRYALYKFSNLSY